VSSRERALQARDYPTADIIQDILKTRGVSLDAHAGRWYCVDGREGYLDSTRDRVPLSAAVPPSIDIRRSVDPRLNPRRDMHEIERLVDIREFALSKHDYRQAEDVRQDLWRDFGVQVFDEDRSWRGPGGLEGRIRPLL
jgi:cysteinyl-tRNA synthetase